MIKLLLSAIAGLSVLAALVPLSRYHRSFVMQQLYHNHDRNFQLPQKRVLFSTEFFDGCSVQPLSAAIRDRQMNVVESMLASGVDVNEQGRCGMTLLIWSLLCRNNEACQLLLKHGANPDLALSEPVEYRDDYVEDGNSFLFIAINRSRPDLFRQALPLNRNITQTNRYGTNLLGHFVIRRLNRHEILTDSEVTEVLDYLLSHGIDINSHDHGGNTALHHALVHDPSLAVPLIDRGADPLRVNSDGFTVPRQLEEILKHEPGRQSRGYQPLQDRLVAMDLFDPASLRAIRVAASEP